MKKARYEGLRSELHKMDSEDKKTFQGAAFPPGFFNSDLWDGIYTQQSY